MIALLLVACAPDGDADGWSARDDCDDADPAVHPDADEVCDGIDNDCDGATDPASASDTRIWHADADGDGFGEPSSGSPVCEPPEGRAWEGTDCDDADPDVHPEALEVCDDAAVDEDCDGEVDEETCARAWVTGGSDRYAVGRVLTVASNDPTLWAYGATRTDDHGGTLGGLAWSSGTTLDPLWSIAEGPSASLVAAIAHEDRRVVAHSLGDTMGPYTLVLADVPGPAGGEPTIFASFDASFTGPPAAVWGIDVWSEDGGLQVALGFQGSTAWVVHEVADETAGITDRADVTITSDVPEAGFGDGVVFLPDPGGDGIAELVVSAPGGYYYNIGVVYVFDGALRGTLSVEDADATMAHEVEYMGARPRRIGDMDGDGSEDLLAGHGSGSSSIWFGPFSGPIPRDGMLGPGGWAVAGGVSIDGDDRPDLAIARADGSAIDLYAGPIEAGTYDLGDADYTIPAGSMSMRYSEIIFADANADGALELLVGDDYFGDDGAGLAPGLVALFDLSGF